MDTMNKAGKMGTLKQKERLGRPFKTVLIILISVVAICIAVFAYCAIPFRTEAAAVGAMETGNGVIVRDLGDGKTAFIPDQPASAGLIFYPGARIQSDAYAPLMRSLAERGILTVSLDVPFHLAFFAVNAADGVAEQFPEIETWYVGGHSLGAAIAGQYLAAHRDSLDGLIMFAGFITDDISDTDLKVLSIYGTLDGVLTDGLYDRSFHNLPASTEEFVIEGANHAGFAYYGDQPGDRKATISKEQQIAAAARYCAEQIELFQAEKEDR